MFCFGLSREAPAGPGDPGNAHGGLREASRGPPDPPGPGSKNLKTNTFCRPIERPRKGTLDAVPKPAAEPEHAENVSFRQIRWQHSLSHEPVVPGGGEKRG